MRGGHRQRLLAGAKVKVPGPPKGLDPEQKTRWVRLADQVNLLGTYGPSDYTAFAQLVRTVTRAEVCPLDAPPSAAARLEGAAAAALVTFGLTPASRVRVKLPKDDRSAAQRILDELEEERDT